MALPALRQLEPGLSAAERLLSGEDAFAAVLAALPDERHAALALNALLDAVGAHPRLVGLPGSWRLEYVGVGSRSDELAQAAVALAEVVAVAGWRRVKQCVTCGRPFLDRTNGCSRRWCDDHRRNAG